MTDWGWARQVPGWLVRLDDVWATRAFYAAVSLGACAGVFLVLRDLLHGDSFWFDELYYLGLLRLPLAEAMSRHIRVDVHPPLYFFLLGAWTQVCGTGEAAVRSLSALGALGALAVLWRLGGGQASRAALALASLWLATHWMWVIYAREARMYGLAILGGCWLALAFARLWNAGREPFLRELWPFCLGALLLAFLHYSAMALACSALLLLLFRLRRRPGLWFPLVAVGALCAAWTLWHGLNIYLGRHIPFGQVGSLPGPLASALMLWTLLLPGNSFPDNYSPSSPALLLAWAGLLCVYGLVAVAWVRRGRFRRDDGRTGPEDPDRAMLRSQLLLLAAFLAAISVVHEIKPFLMHKVAVMMLPSLALCLGCVAAVLWRGRAWALCCLALALGGISLPLAVHGLEERWLRGGVRYDGEGIRDMARLLEEEPGGLRLFCISCRPHMVKAFMGSIDIGEPHPQSFARVAVIEDSDVRHLAPPAFILTPRWLLDRELQPDVAVRVLGTGEDPRGIIDSLRAYHLVQAPGVETE